ncbi:MAG: glycoside hydrolase family 9 protein [Leadbetterella sp.]
MKKKFTALLKGATLMLSILIFGQNGMAQSLSQKTYIAVDQFGYIPSAKKVAIISKPVNGFNSSEAGVVPYNPGSQNVQLIKIGANNAETVEYQALPTQWQSGNTDSFSGDKGYWFDFSSVTTVGTFKVRVYTSSTAYVDSYVFKIDANVYTDVLKRAMNMYYYQRANFNKVTPSSNTTGFAAGKTWEDGAWYNASNQSSAVVTSAGGNPTRSISGGWIDAGDPNRYVSFVAEPVHDLFTSYEQYKSNWDNLNLNLPESSNSIPDILDEVRYEINWIKTMQNYNYSSNSGDGVVYNKVGIFQDGGYTSPPSTDTRALRYEETPCPHSSVMAAGMFAHAALVYNMNGNSSLTAEVPELTARAEKAWTFYNNSSDKSKDCDNGDIEAGNGDGPGPEPSAPNYAPSQQYTIEHKEEAVCAAVYLYALTGNTTYRDFVDANYTIMRPMLFTSGEWAVYRSNQAEALLYYAYHLPSGRTATQSVKDAIINRKIAAASATDSKNPYKVVASDNLYRSLPYYSNWGTNSTISRLGSDNLDYVRYNLVTTKTSEFKERAQGIVNYLHGTNPFGLCFLTNMGAYGADFSAMQMHHTWFYSGTQFDNQDASDIGPAPGYITGGINGSNKPSCGKMLIGKQSYNAYMKDQPVQKAYTERVNYEGTCSDGSLINQPWIYNEPGVYYQAAYIKLLAHVVFGGGNSTTVSVTSVSTSPATLSKEAGLNHQITATISPSNASNTSVTWSSSNTGVATVNSNGLIETIAAGTANIIATSNNSKRDTTVVTVTAAASAVACGLVSNSNFNANLVGWKNDAGVAAISSDVRSGSSGTKSVVITGGGGFEVRSRINVTNGYKLNYTCYAKLEGTPTNAMMGIDFYNSAGTKLENKVINITGTSWAQFSNNEVPPVGTASVVLWFYKDGSGKLFVDDVCLNQNAVNCGLVNNSGFESDFSSWTNTNTNASIVTAEKRSDRKALSMNNNNGGIQYASQINVTAGHIVNFEAYAYVSGSPSIAQIGVDFLNANNGEEEEQVLTVTATSYAKYAFSIVPKTGSTKVLIWIYKGSGGKLYVDDICMTTAPNTCGLMSNPGFEANFGSWTNTNTNASIVSNEKRSGRYAVSLNNNNGGIQYGSQITVTSGHRVNLQGYAYLTGSPSAAVVGFDHINSSGNEIGETSVNVTGTSYTSFSVSAVPTSGTTKVVPWIYKGNNGKIFLDDFCLTTQSASREGVDEEFPVDEPVAKEALNPLYPNVVSELMKIPVREKGERAVIVEVVDMKGNLKVHQLFRIREGANEVQMSTSGLQSGSYMVRIIQGKSVNTQRIVKN